MSRKGFFDFFPPPNFLLMPAVGLSISEDAIRFVRFKRGSKGSHGLVLSDFGEEKIPSGSIVDGAPAKPDQIIAALKKLKQEHKILFANVALPDDKAYVFKSNINVPAGADIADSVAFILEENIPIAPAETVFDFSIVSEGGAASAGSVTPVGSSAPVSEVVVTAFPEEVVGSYLEIFKAVGIKVLSFNIQSEAVRRAVISYGDEAPRLIANFSGDKVVLAIVSKNLVQFVSVVNSNADISPKELESRARDNIAESVELVNLQNEIKKVCSYWFSGSVSSSSLSSKAKAANKIKSIVISGDVDPKVDIVTFLTKHTGMNVALANVWQNAFSLDETIPEISFENSLHFASAIGMAL